MSDFIFYHENTKHPFPLILFSCFRLPRESPWKAGIKTGRSYWGPFGLS